MDPFLFREVADESDTLSSDADRGEKGGVSCRSGDCGERRDGLLAGVEKDIPGEEWDHPGEAWDGDSTSELERICRYK